MTKTRLFSYIGVICLLWIAVSMERANHLVIIPSKPAPTFDIDELSKSFGPHTDSKLEEWDTEFKSNIIPIDEGSL